MIPLDAFLASGDVGAAIASLLLVVGILIGGALGVAFYLLPLIVAVMNKSHLVGPVAVVNILLGWTLLGWVGALVLALMPKPSPTVVVNQVSQPNPQSTLPSMSLPQDQWWDGHQWRQAVVEHGQSITEGRVAET